MSQGNENSSILEVKGLKKHYPILGGVLRRPVGYVYAVDGVSFSVKKGETLGIVGESGCGKTTIAKCIIRLEEPTDGNIIFENIDLSTLQGKALKNARRDMQMVFQDPYSSLDSRMKVGSIIGEPLYLQGVDAKKRVDRVRELLTLVGLDEKAAELYPHEFSGGQRQRICIARALTTNPNMIICDEPTSALDVSIQSQILNLLLDLQEKFALTYLFVSHDLNIVRHISDRVMVMYLGKIMEMGSAKELFKEPQHPYTKALIASVPLPNPKKKDEIIELEGGVPSPSSPPEGCRFHTRCKHSKAICKESEAELKEVNPSHYVSCHIL